MLAVRVVGVGDAFTARYHNACLLVEWGTPPRRLLIDAPPALARALADLGAQGGAALGLDDIDAVVITHLHGDHMGGLEQLLYWRRFVTQKKLTLYALPEVLSGLWRERLQGGMEWLLGADGTRQRLGLDDYCEPVPLYGPSLALPSLTLEWRRNTHHIPTSALRFSHHAKSFGYSADTAYDEHLIGWLAECDGFLHETNHGVHTPLARLAALPEALRAKMHLIHYPDQLDVATAPIACARQGQRLVP